MGSWGDGPFDNDSAMDFIDGLVDGEPAHVVPALISTLDRLVTPGGAQDYDLSVQGLAAAALLAGFVPYPGDAQTAEWVTATIPPLSPEVAALAGQAIDTACGDDAVFADYAAEDGRLSNLLAAIRPVRQRLRAAVPPPQVETLF